MSEENPIFLTNPIQAEQGNNLSLNELPQRKIIPTISWLHPGITLRNIEVFDSSRKRFTLSVPQTDLPSPKAPANHSFPALLPLSQNNKRPTDIAIHGDQIPLLLQLLSHPANNSVLNGQTGLGSLFLSANKTLNDRLTIDNITASTQLSFKATLLYINEIQQVTISSPDPHRIILTHQTQQKTDIYYKMPLDCAIHLSRVLAKLGHNKASEDLPAISFYEETILTSFEAQDNDLFSITQKKPTPYPRYFKWKDRAKFFSAIQDDSRRIPASNMDILKNIAPTIFWWTCLSCKVTATFCTTMKFLNLTNNQITNIPDHNFYLLAAKITISTLDALQTLAARLLKDQAHEPLAFAEPPRPLLDTNTPAINTAQTNLFACCNSKEAGLNIFNLGIGCTTIIQTYFNYKYLNLIFSNTPVSILISLGNSPIFIKFRCGKMRYNQLIDFFTQLNQIRSSNGSIIFQSFNNFFYFTIGITALTLQCLLTLLNLAITFKNIKSLPPIIQTITTTAITLLFLVSITMPMVGCSFKRMVYEENKDIDTVGALSFITFILSTLAMIYFSNSNNEPTYYIGLPLILLSMMGTYSSNKTSSEPFINAHAIQNELTRYFKKKTHANSNNFYFKLKISQGKSSIHYIPGKKPRCISTFNLSIDLLNIIDIIIAILSSTLALLGHKNTANSPGHLAIMILISVYASIFSFPAARDNNTYTNHHIQQFLTEIENHLSRIIQNAGPLNVAENRTIEIGRRISRIISDQLIFKHSYTPKQIIQALNEKYPERFSDEAPPDGYIALNASESDSTDQQFSDKDWPFFVAWIFAKHSEMWGQHNRVSNHNTPNTDYCFYTGIVNSNSFYTKCQYIHLIESNKLLPGILQASYEDLSSVIPPRQTLLRSPVLTSFVNICDSDDETQFHSDESRKRPLSPHSLLFV